MADAPETTAPTPPPCPACGGTGRVIRSVPYVAPDLWSTWEEGCAACGGEASAGTDPGEGSGDGAGSERG